MTPNNTLHSTSLPPLRSGRVGGERERWAPRELGDGDTAATCQNVGVRLPDSGQSRQAAPGTDLPVEHLDLATGTAIWRGRQGTGVALPLDVHPIIGLPMEQSSWRIVEIKRRCGASRFLFR
jgi:hypothetical protein